jgi:hypothetical protein
MSSIHRSSSQQQPGLSASQEILQNLRFDEQIVLFQHVPPLRVDAQSTSKRILAAISYARG